MLRDAQLSLCTAQAFSADAATTNGLDLGVARNIGDGNRLSFYIHTTVAADHTTGDETYSFDIQTDGDSAFGSATKLHTVTIPYSSLTANSLVEIPLPEGLVFERYARIFFDGAGTTPTVTASIWLGASGELPSVKTYPNGYEN